MKRSMLAFVLCVLVFLLFSCASTEETTVKIRQDGTTVSSGYTENREVIESSDYIPEKPRTSTKVDPDGSWRTSTELFSWE